MARLPPNRRSRRREEEQETMTSSGNSQQSEPQSDSPTNIDSTPDSTPRCANSIASTPLSHRSQSSSPITPLSTTTAHEEQRRSGFLALLPNAESADMGNAPASADDESPITTNTSTEQQSPAINNQLLEDYFKKQEAFNQRIEEQLRLALKECASQKPTSKRLPKDLTANVRDVYTKIPDNLKWDLTKRFADQDREKNAEIFARVRSTDSSTASSLITKAMRVHFKTKRRQHQNKVMKRDRKILKEQRKRTRLNLKRAGRKKALQQSTSITEEEKKKYSLVMTNDFMSSEESASDDHVSDSSSGSDDEENEVKRKVFVLKSLTWRSDELNKVMKALDRKSRRRKSQKSLSMSIQRRNGAPSRRQAPIDAPEFAIKPEF